MNTALLISCCAAVPAAFLITAAVLHFRRARRLATTLQLLGAAGFVVVVLAHLCEGLGLFLFMGWGEPESPGHYLDLASALTGIVAFPLGYLLNAFEKKA